MSGETVVALLAQASGEIGAVPKDATMAGRDSYKYRSIEAIAERAQPTFAKLGLVIVPHRCTDLAFEPVENKNGTRGRHYLGRWLWRVYGPAGDYVELETPGECAEWGGDKGGNKAFTASRKNALVAALNLAENAADPDTYRGGGDEHEPVQVDAMLPETWTAIRALRDALDDEGRQEMRAWSADQRIGSPPATETEGQAWLDRARAVFALLAPPAARARAAVDPNADPPHPTEEEPQVPPRSSRNNSLDSGAWRGDEGPDDPHQGGPVESVMVVPAVVTDIANIGVVDRWRCNGKPVHDVRGPAGSKCPVPNCAGYLTDEPSW